MENTAITPQAITQLANMSPEDISLAAESVMEATQLGNRTIDELTNLSQCLADFADTQEKYHKTAKHVKNQMRYISNHL